MWTKLSRNGWSRRYSNNSILSFLKDINKVNRDVVLKYKEDLKLLSYKYSGMNFNLFFPLLEIWKFSQFKTNQKNTDHSSGYGSYIINHWESDQDFEDFTKEYIKDKIKNNSYKSSGSIRRLTVQKIEDFKTDVKCCFICYTILK